MELIHRHHDGAEPPGLVIEVQAAVADEEVVSPDLVRLGAWARTLGLLRRLDFDRRSLPDLREQPSGRLPRKPLQPRRVLQARSAPGAFAMSDEAPERRARKRCDYGDSPVELPEDDARYDDLDGQPRPFNVIAKLFDDCLVVDEHVRIDDHV